MFVSNYLTLRLKRLKTDINYKGVNIIVARTGEYTYTYIVLQRLYIHNPQPLNTPLFLLGISFDYNTVV